MKSYLEKGIRFDSRKFNEWRSPIKIETDISKSAEGSAKVTLGETEVFAGVKITVGEPYPDSQDAGVLITGAELSPMASPEFETGPPGEKAIELARVVDRGIRESKMIDFKKLCIRKGELVWIVFVDIYPLNDAGNLLDAAALAAISALNSAVLPKLEKDRVVYGEFTKTKLPIVKTPLTASAIRIENSFLADPSSEEEKVFEAKVTATIDENNNIHAMQKSGEAALSVEEIDKMVDLIIESTKELRKKIK